MNSESPRAEQLIERRAAGLGGDCAQLRKVQPQPLLVCGSKSRPCIPGGQMFFLCKILNFYMKHADF